jgi:hypothetical protein
VRVAAQFAPSGPDAQAVLEQAVGAYITRKTNQDGVDLLRDLAVTPTVEIAPNQHLWVTFEGRPANREWRDWMVEFTAEARRLPGLDFEGFFDRVSGRLGGKEPT